MSLRDGQKFRIKFDPPFFRNHATPIGLLSHDREEHALMYYYILANSALSQVQDVLILEGEKDIDPKYEKLFKKCAMMYGVDVNTMANRWLKIDAEIQRYNRDVLEPGGAMPLKILPAKYKFMNKLILVRH